MIVRRGYIYIETKCPAEPLLNLNFITQINLEEILHNVLGYLRDFDFLIKVSIRTLLSKLL
jgi:hypothetical protein